MQQTLVEFETAKLAKEKGFPVLNEGYGYTENGRITDPMFGKIVCEAPPLSLVHKWLMKEKMIRVFPKQGVSGNFNFEIYKWNFDNQVGKWERIGNISSLPTYEEALEKGIQEGLKFI